MPGITRLLPVAVFLCASIPAVLYDYHIFQLNSYEIKTQVKWLARNWLRGYLLRHILVFYYCLKPHRAKKPLVYTPRLKRMLVTHGLLTAVGIGLFLPRTGFIPGGLLLLGGLFFLSPALALLSNMINAPLEGAIKRWYIADAQRILRKIPRLTVIGVTGSYGKTSTKYFLSRLLASKYNVLMTPESYNTPMGVVKTIRTRLKPIHEIFVCEMGAKKIGEIKEICDIVFPACGIITSIGPQHLETFKSLENIISTKFELARALPEGGVIFLNYENEYVRTAPCSQKRLSYGRTAAGCHYLARNIRVSGVGSAFDLTLSGGREYHFETKLLGLHQVENITGAIAVADYLGVAGEELVVAVRRLQSVPHRLELLRRNGLTIIDDSYNANVSGTRAALEVLGMFDGLKILVTPGMIELGDAEDQYNRQFGAAAAAVCDYVILVGARQTRSILAGLKSAAYPEEKIYIVQNPREAFEKIDTIPERGFPKVVLLENDLPDNY
ncbi:MAG: UDP-N-acetylmuramoyl-tripeptide--D-alanyl-D-alanine ligase [Spirochaetaceae bacterium]|jgi:UDP-N-acetylmuramoyl-tripeptide--D-alanyl-D-alanine ligase|nr:UDP-N-acetylmuramoyl-tripeptide--D-alanyl-D-alanine ligase [Spirochaetaceae bacterium]